MKLLAYILTIAVIAHLLAGCGSTLSLSRPIGDGKGYVNISDSGASVGYRGSWWSKPIATPAPKDSKTVLPAQPVKPGVFQTVKGWFL